MTKPIYGSRMLQTARRLAGANAGRGRPALCDLRRATSTAYYALFHAIVRHGSREFLPSGTEDEVAEVARWFTHTGVKQASNILMDAAGSKSLTSIRKEDRAAVMALRSAAGHQPIHQDLVIIADSFGTLQAARHDADYNGNYDPVRASAMNHIDDAEAALKATRSLWKAQGSSRQNRALGHEAYRVFLRIAMLKSMPMKAR